MWGRAKCFSAGIPRPDCLGVRWHPTLCSLNSIVSRPAIGTTLAVDPPWPLGSETCEERRCLACHCAIAPCSEWETSRLAFRAVRSFRTQACRSAPPVSLERCASALATKPNWTTTKRSTRGNMENAIIWSASQVRTRARVSTVTAFSARPLHIVDFLGGLVF